MLVRVVVAALLFGACTHPAGRTQRAATPGQPLPAPEPLPNSATPNADFARDIAPILESRCQPCHFTGGRMYERLPFDKPETIRQLGTKLFTRIKDEASQAKIRQFLSEAE